MKHILIVDDSSENLTVLKAYLEEDYKVTPVPSGEMALRFLAERVPDLILLDIAMPEMDGFELFERIKKDERLSAIPVMFLTGVCDAETEAKGFSLGADDFIAKPFDPSVLKYRIHRILELYQLREKLERALHEKSEQLDNLTLVVGANTEPLTGLYNRAYMEAASRKYLEENHSGVFFMMDIDNFKKINDSRGHIVGDHVLRVFAKILRKAFREDDILCRMGGDEFVVFMTGKPERKTIEKKMRIVFNGLRESDDLAACGVETAVSVGIAMAPENGDTYEELYSCADKALYSVKQSGKNMFRFYGLPVVEEVIESTETDMMNIRRLLEGELNTDDGALSVEYEEFRQIYNYIIRYVNRNENHVQTLLFTIRPAKSRNLDAQILAQAMYTLNMSVVDSLRKVDVGTKYSSNQYIVILTDTNAANGKMVADRVVERFYKECDRNVMTIGYDLETIIPKNRHFMF